MALSKQCIEENFFYQTRTINKKPIATTFLKEGLFRDNCFKIRNKLRMPIITSSFQYYIGDHAYIKI